MSKKIQDKLSMVAVHIRLLFEETCLATGSAFLWRHENKSYLISNWHNFAGRNPETKEPLDKKTLGTPDRVECYLYKNRVSNGVRTEGVFPDAVIFQLVDENSKPLFIEHFLGSVVDVAALPIEPGPDVVPFFLNEQEFEEKIRIYPGQDVFIVGYPLGLITGMSLPIWKRGTVASEPQVPIGNLKKVLVDTASRKGMSGSFVVAQHTGYFNPAPGPLPSADAWFGSGRKILGIYSGRIGPSDFEAQVGIVWHREVIDEVLTKGRQAEI